MSVFKNYLFFLISLFMISINANAETDTACKRNDSGEIVINGSTDGQLVTDTSNNDGNACKEIPDFYKVKFYRFGLCKSDPITNGNSLNSCTLFVNSDVGIDHIIEGVGSSSALDVSTADPNILPGTYSYLILLVSNELAIKHSEKFSSSITGKTGAGKNCWTIDSKTAFGGFRTSGMTIPQPGAGNRSSLAMDCGSTAGTAAFTTEVFDGLGDGSWTGQDLSDPSVALVRLLKNDNITAATDENDGARMLVSIPNSATVTIKSKFSITFKLTDAVSIDFAPDGGVIYALKNGADPFQITLSITE